MYYLDSGYGQVMATALHRFSNGGKVFVVAKTAQAGRQLLQSLFRVDPDGSNRYASTIEGALASAVANRGDTILVAPGHTETVSEAGGLVLNKAGVAIIGLGERSDRPTITLDTANTATITVTAANISFENFIVKANFLSIAKVFDLSTAKNFCIKGCKFGDTSSILTFLSLVGTNATSNASDGLKLIDNEWVGLSASATSMANVAGDNDDVEVKGNYVNLAVNNNKAALMAVADGKKVTNLQMVDNKVVRLNTDTATGAILFHTNQTTNTGVVAGNFAQHADDTGELLITATSGLSLFENYASGVNGASGYILPARDS